MRQSVVARREIAHAPGCPCPPCRRAEMNFVEIRQIEWGQRRRPRSLIARFRDAAEPGDLGALALGTAIGMALAVVAVTAHYWNAILAILGAI